MEPSTERPAARKRADSRASSEHYDIVIVEDDPSCREAMGYVLEADGYRVGMAESSEEALSLLSRAESPPRLILLDIVMPGRSGEELLSDLRKSPTLARVPVVFVSGLHDLPARAQTLGVDGYLKKPPTLDDLFDVSRRFAGEPPDQYDRGPV